MLLSSALSAITQPAASAAPSSTNGPRPTIVLVHGAWADGSSFAPITTALQKAGYKVLVAPNPLRGLQSDTDYLISYIQQATTGPVVLVGHSYGGVVITNAATSLPNVEALVYVDAYAPDIGESAKSLNAAQPGSLLNVDPKTVFTTVHSPGMQPGENDTYIRQDKYRTIFAANLPSVETKMLAASQSPTNSSAVETALSSEPAWKTIPSWFFIGTQDKVLPPAQQRIMAKRAGGNVTEGAASHLSMLEKPALVTQVIIKAAKSVK
ncbi:alpha/beta fold hydrolase [Agreia sp. Leaf244]|uniref:alpha/beta fold hydrolase n=1 Tax=Agreia sp. Leaf244 TaxID=1736305 RepID=UPI00138EE5C7|nr:alpha/beta hydrolase [Agreia sp. Leaf244]